MAVGARYPKWLALVNGNMDSNLRSPGGLILTHTQISMEPFGPFREERRFSAVKAPGDFCSAGYSRSPSSALLAFFGWEGSPTKIDFRKQIGHPYSKLSNLEDLAFDLG